MAVIQKPDGIWFELLGGHVFNKLLDKSKGFFVGWEIKQVRETNLGKSRNFRTTSATMPNWPSVEMNIRIPYRSGYSFLTSPVPVTTVIETICFEMCPYLKLLMAYPPVDIQPPMVENLLDG